MKEFYYLSGRETRGPYSIQELLEIDLSPETLVWKEGEGNWKKLKEFPEIHQISIPPPPPETSMSNETKDSSTEVSKSDGLKWLILWCAFHSFALIMSYSKVKIFNNSWTGPHTSKFWPFVSFTHEIKSSYIVSDLGKTEFHGFFTEYDWTEFAVYIGMGLLIFFLTRTSK